MYNISKYLNISAKYSLYTIIFLVFLYLTFHSIYGSRGIIAYFRLYSQIDDSYPKLELLREERLEIENRTKLLRPESIDKDMLDEMVRNMLGFSSKKELIYNQKNE